MFYSIFKSINRATLSASILLGIALSISISVFLVPIKHFSPQQFLLLATFLAIFFFVFNYWLLGKILAITSGYSLKTKLLWGGCCLLTGVGLVFIVPLSTTAPSYHTLKVIALGQQNTQAKGSEVWLYSIQTSNGFDLNRSALSLSQGWEYRDSTLLSYDTQPATIEYSGLINGNLTLTFGSHPWSGKVRIVFDNDKKVVDLYSNITTSKSFVLPIASSPLLSFIVLMGNILALSFLVFITTAWFVTVPIQPLEPIRDLSSAKDIITPETAFLVLAIFFGISFALITPPFQVADENAHFNYAYAISIGQFSGYRSVVPHSISELWKATAHLPFKPDEKVSYQELSKFIKVPLDINNLDHTYFQSVSKVDPVPYIPIVLGLEIAKLLNLNVFDFFFFGRIFHLCIWILISYSALKFLPEFKWVFLLFILSPMSLSIAGSYSADAITNSISFLWFGLCFNYATPRENGINSKSKFLLILSAALLALMKPPYVLLIGLFFLIPRTNFGSQRQYQRTTILLFTIIFILTLFSLSYLLKNDYSTTNSRPGLDFINQARYLLNNPLEFPQIIIRSVKLLWKFYFSSYIGRLGWLDTVLPEYIYTTYPIMMLLIFMIDQKRYLNFALWQKLILFLTAVAVFSAIFFSLYLIWTPVGYKTLEGLQGRYLIPIGPVLIPLFTNKFFSKSPSWKSVLVIVYLIIVLGITARTLILRYYVG